MEIDLSNTNEKAFIDTEDYLKVSQHTWRFKHSSNGRKYVATRLWINGRTKTLYLHRFIMTPQSHQDVHHKDGNTRNNYKSNLQVINSMKHRKDHLKDCRLNS